MTLYDFAITAKADTVDRLLHQHSELLLHRLDCPVVMWHRLRGDEIGNFLGCTGIPNIERCECLEDMTLAHSKID